MAARPMSAGPFRRTPDSLLAYECRRNPALAAFLESLPAHSLDEIAVAPFAKWVRAMLRQQWLHLRDAGIEADILANVPMTHGFTPDPSGNTRIWTGPTRDIRLKRGALEIEAGTACWFPETGGVWIDTIFCEHIDPALLQALTPAVPMTRSQYRQECRTIANRSTVSLRSATNETSSGQGFTIFRPG